MYVDTRTIRPFPMKSSIYSVGSLIFIILDHAYVRQNFGAPRWRIMYPKYPKYTSLICLYNWMTRFYQSGHRTLEYQHGVDGFKIGLVEYIVCTIQYYTDQCVGFNNFQPEPPPPPPLTYENED